MNDNAQHKWQRCLATGWRSRSALALALVLALAHQAQAAGNEKISNFRQAKVLLALLYAERPQTLYSDCRYEPSGVVDATGCGFVPTFKKSRDNRIEWEHVVPAEAFGRAFLSWREGDPLCVHANGRPFRGRRCATKVDANYRRMEADLYNLVPEVDEINRRRSNKPMGVIGAASPVLTPAGSRVLGRTFEPRDAVKGDVARIYLYMDEAYPEAQVVSARRRALFLAWARQDPVDAWECRRAWRIEGLQGNPNPWVRKPCQALQLWPGE